MEEGITTKQRDGLWYKNAVFYELNLRAFKDGNGDGIGDFVGLISKLDYLQSLGIDCIWLLPFYPSPLLDDGYDVSDYYQVHPDLGTLEDFKTFVEASHARGLRVIIDLVLNHTSDQHPWFQSARSNPNSPYRDYYVWSNTDQKYLNTRIIFLDTEPSNWTFDEVAGLYYWHRFYACQPDLNYDNPAVQEEMLNVVKFWLDLGVDGFRADAVPYLFEREGTNCENLPETHEYLKRLRRFVDENYPGRILLCEANQWPQDVRLYFGNGDEFHMGFHFPLMPRIFMAIGKEDTSPLVWALERTPPIPDSCQWCTFLRNHDELTLEMVTEEERQWMWEKYAPDQRMRLNLGIRRRLAPLLDNDRRKIELAYALLFSLPGSPAIYYGDEIGMGDNIWLKDRNGVRTPMQWDGSENAGYSSAPSDRLYTPVIRDGEFDYRAVNVWKQNMQPDSLLNWLRHLIRIRKENPALGSGSLEIIPVRNPGILVYLRRHAEQTLLIIHNLSSNSHQFDVKLDRGIPFKLVDMITREQTGTDASGTLKIQLGPQGYRWFRLLEIVA